jgi:hypothetical protein
VRICGPQSQTRQKENIPLLLKSHKNNSIFWNIIPSRPVKVSRDISEEHIASIFRAVESAKQETRMKQTASCDIFLQNAG